MVSRHSRRRRQQTTKISRRWWWREPANWLALVVAILAVTTVVFVLEKQRPPAVDIDRAVIALAGLNDSRMAEIEGRFRCPCGNCDHLDLRNCECDAPGGALEIKTAIARLLDQGVGSEEVVRVVANRFGGLRAASDPGSRVPSGEALMEGTEAADQSKGLIVSHGNHVDPVGFVKVVSSFDCPCGNCVLTLLDCTCERSRGAVELKNLINNRLADGMLPDQVVEIVERTYSLERRLKRADSGLSTIRPK